MVVVMQEGATEEQIQRVINKLMEMGFDIHRSTGARYTVLGAVGAQIADTRDLELIEGVHEVDLGFLQIGHAHAVDHEPDPELLLGHVGVGDLVVQVHGVP